MQMVLAVEPDEAQGKLLRGLVSGPDTELVLVSSANAALDTINRRQPDLILLSESLGAKTQPIVERLRSMPGAANVQTLPIPSLKTTDPEAFAAEVTLCLLRTAADAKKAHSKEAPKGAAIAHELHEAHIALLQADAEERLAAELERVRREAAEQRTAELARLQAESEEKRRAEVAAARAAAADEARSALTAELAGIRGEAEDLLAAELERVRNEAAQKMAAQLAEAEAERQAAVEQARLAAEQAASQALDAEVARIKAETDGRLAAELQRVRQEAQQARASEQQGREEAEATLAAEVARVQRESEARLEAELARARAEADEARRTQQEQIDLDAIRDAAAREARAAAEQAAAQALEAEAARVRAEAEARLQEELARVRADAERVRQEQEQAQLEAEAARDAAVREAREAALREAREAAAQEARAAAEATAIRRAEAEVARVRAEAEMKLRAELERREQAEIARAADLSQLEQVRQEVEREARQRADEVLKAEIARARAEAEQRLAAEVAEVQAEAERRRNAELAEIRNQLAHANAVAREHARVAAKGAVSAEVARAEKEMPGAASQAASIGAQAAIATLRAAEIAVRGIGQSAGAAASAIGWMWRQVPTGVGVAIIGVAAIVAAAVILDVQSLTSRAAAAAIAMFRDAEGGSDLGSDQGSDLASERGPDPGSDPAFDATATAAEPAVVEAPGTLALFSRVPVDLFIAGKRIGNSETGQIILQPGQYRIEMVNERLNYRGTATINIRPAAVTSYTVTLPTGRLQVNTEPGAQVSIEGRGVGVAPLGPLPVQIGTREVVVTHPDLGERREFVEVRLGSVTEVTIARREAIDPSKAYPLPNLGQPSAPIRGQPGTPLQ